ncbi:hypothetical protein LCGC14_3046270, partial [marine sediment metagenome]
ETAKNRFSKRNAIKIAGPKLGEEPEEDDIETLCEGVMRIFHAVCVSKEGDAAEEPVPFRLMFDCKDKDGNRSRPSFRYTYDPDDAESDPDPSDYPLDPQTESFLAAIDVRDRFIDKLCLRIDDAHGRIIEQAGETKNTIKPIMDAYGVMGGMYAAGLHMQQHALALIFDTKRTDAEQKGADARHERTMRMIEKPLKIAMAQGMAFFAKTTGTPVADLADMFDEEDEDEDGDEAAPGGSADAANDGPEDDGLSDEDRENPISTICRELGNTLRGSQWFGIMDALRTKKNIAILRAVLTVQNDDVAADAGTIGYEVLTSLGSRYHRVHTGGG